jgi:hypothetical protein
MEEPGTEKYFPVDAESSANVIPGTERKSDDV